MISIINIDRLLLFYLVLLFIFLVAITLHSIFYYKKKKTQLPISMLFAYFLVPPVSWYRSMTCLLLSIKSRHMTRNLSVILSCLGLYIALSILSGLLGATIELGKAGLLLFFILWFIAPFLMLVSECKNHVTIAHASRSSTSNKD